MPKGQNIIPAATVQRETTGMRHPRGETSSAA